MGRVGAQVHWHKQVMLRLGFGRHVPDAHVPRQVGQIAEPQGGSRVEVVVVAAPVVVVVEATVVVVAPAAVVVVVVPTTISCANPGMLVEPGPGRSAIPSIAEFVVLGMQKTDARMEACGMPSVRSPPGVPVSLMHREPPIPKAPAVLCAPQTLWFVQVGGFRHVQSLSVLQGAPVSAHDFAVQKLPSAAVRLATPVVRGFRVTPSGAANAPKARSGGQSWLVPLLLVEVQAPAAFAP